MNGNTVITFIHLKCRHDPIRRHDPWQFFGAEEVGQGIDSIETTA
ncbi:hypothetical protein [Rhizobium sp. NZLR8]|nr:hypothetical protein [Rhizobium sp. NZLR8]